MNFVLGAEVKLVLFLYNNEWLYYKITLILILKYKQENKEIDTK